MAAEATDGEASLIDPETLAELTKKVAERETKRATLEALIGRFITSFNDLNGWIDTTAMIYFKPGRPEGRAGGRRNIPFRTWILARLTMRDKIDVLRQVTDEVGLTSLFQPMIREMDRLNELRNELAHSTLNIDLRGITDEPTPEAYAEAALGYLRSHRTGLKARPASISELTRAVSTLDKLQLDLFRFTSAIIAADAGEDPVNAVRHFDEMNPRHRDASTIPVELRS